MRNETGADPAAAPGGAPMFAAVVAALRAAGCVFAEDEARLLLAQAPPPRLAALLARRVRGEPLEYVLGWAEFAGLRLDVEPGVFIPRRRTELLVEVAARHTTAGAVVLDMCCGTGALGIALTSAVSGVQLHATDIDPAATHCAQRNILRHKVSGRVYTGDLFAPLPAALHGRVHTLLANVPYVPTAAIAQLPPEFRIHEARPALDGGADGLDIFRRMVAGAAPWLRPGGALYSEIGADQAVAASAVLTAHGFHAELVDAADDLVIVGALDKMCCRSHPNEVEEVPPLQL